MKALALTVVLAAACNWSLHRMQRQEGCRVAQQTQLLAGGSCNLQPPVGIVAFGPPQTPPPLTRKLVLRGRDRFEKFCAPCHGIAGDGDSQIARVMTLRRPPSLVDRFAASLPDQRFVFVMEHGYGLMPSYGTSLPYRDRYAVLHYIRALQGREVALASLPAALQHEAKQWLP
jgi:hypothetical protein